MYPIHPTASNIIKMILAPLHTSSNTFHQQNSFCGICLSVCHISHITFVHTILERGRKFIFLGKLPPTIRRKGGRSRSLELKCINRFCTYLRQKWIDLRQTKTKMTNGTFYTYRQIHLIGGNASFSDICLSVCHISRLLSIGTLQKELKSLVVSSIGTCTLLNRNHINV